MRLDNFGLLDELPDEIERRDEDLHRVLAEEGGGRPGEVGVVSCDCNQY